MTPAGRRKRVLERSAADRCRGKIPCDSELSARLLAQGSINRSKRSSLRPPAARLWVYRCLDCDRWHMTSIPHPTPAVTATSLGIEGKTI